MVGIKLGIRDLSTLIYLHSFGLVGIPTIIWCLALFKQIKYQLFYTLLIAFSATYLSAGFFTIGEYNLTYALAAYCFSVLVQDKLTHFDSVLIIFAATVLMRPYEAMIFLGPVLFVISESSLISTVLNKTIVDKWILLVLLFFVCSSNIDCSLACIAPKRSCKPSCSRRCF